MQGSYWSKNSGRRIGRRRVLAIGGAGALGAAFIAACGGDDDGGTTGATGTTGSGSTGGGGATGATGPATTGASGATIYKPGQAWQLPDETAGALPGGVFAGVLDDDQAGNYDAMVQAPSQVTHSRHVLEYLMGSRRAPGLDPKDPDADIAIPALAEEFEFSADAMTATFTLRSNVKWQPVEPVNGRLLDIEDARTSVERFLETSPQRTALEEIIDNVEYPDDRHIVMHLAYPYAPMRTRLWSERFAFQIMPKELNADPDLAAEVAIGTGFKILDKHEPAVTMEYRKNPDYWGGDPFIDRWHFPIIPEYANRYAQFVAQQITDFRANHRDLPALLKDAPGAMFVAREIDPLERERMNWGRENSDASPFKDERVRVALRRSMNTRGMAQLLSNSDELQALGFPMEIFTQTHVNHNESYWLDPEKGELGDASANYLYGLDDAKALLAAAGHEDKVILKWQVLLSGAGEEPEQDRLMIDNINLSGLFNVEVDHETDTVAHRNCRSLGQCEYFTRTGLSEDMDYFFRELHSAGNRPGGDRPWKHPELDRIADAYRLATEDEDRISLLKQWQLFNADFMPQIPGVDQFTFYTVRWPWLHNTAHGEEGLSEVATQLWGRPRLGSHLVWLDQNMPNRDG